MQSRNDIEFTGYDITSYNIAQHLQNFNNQTWTFEQRDIVTDTIKVSFDLILSRHTMFHLKTDDVIRVLRNFRSSGSRFLLMTTQAVESNLELDDNNIAHFTSTYRWRPLNFFKEPFNLPAPVCIGRDTNEPSMFIMLYDLQELHDINFAKGNVKEEL